MDGYQVCFLIVVSSVVAIVSTSTELGTRGKIHRISSCVQYGVTSVLPQPTARMIAFAMSFDEGVVKLTGVLLPPEFTLWMSI